MVPADAPERFVEEFVDALDLKRLGFVDRLRPNRRDPHPTSKLLKLVLFAALVRIVGQRALARACRVNVSLLYLSAFDPPGRSSITRFWRDNHRVFPDVLVMLVHHAAEAGLVGMDLHALDGTKIRAASSMHTAVHRAAEKKARRLRGTARKAGGASLRAVCPGTSLAAGPS